MTAPKGTPHGERRWRSHRLAAFLLRVAIFLVPIGVGFGAGALVARGLPEPENLTDVVLWWVLVIGAASAAATLTDRLSRRLLPLTALLRMTMVFPDRAPSRLRVARRAGSVNELRRRVATLPEGGDAAAGEAAELILSLATALSRHDRKTRGHSERTRAYTDLIAEELGIDPEGRDKLRWAALLHDVGKLEVPGEILNKDGALTEEEWEEIRQHPIHGMRLVAPIAPWLGDWAKTIEHHHERWNGSGYPHGLAGTDIALGARIVSVADAYDVMTSGRSYKAAMTPAAARAEVARSAGTQFDPQAARALMNVSLGKLRWATGPLASLAEIPLLRGLPQMGRDLAMMVTSGAFVATTLVTGVLPAAVGVSTPDLLHVTIAGTELPEPTDLRASDGGEQPAALPGDDSATTTADPEGTTTTDEPTGQASGAQAASGSPAPGDGEGSGAAASSSTTTTTTVPVSEDPADDTSPTSSPTTTTTTSPTTTTTTTPTTTSSTTTTTTSTTTTTTTTTTTVPPSLVAVDDFVEVGTGRTVIKVLENDEGDIDQTSVRIVSPPDSGSIDRVGNSGHVFFDAPAGFEQTTFVYEVCDTPGTTCDTATVTVTSSSG